MPGVSCAITFFDIKLCLSFIMTILAGTDTLVLLHFWVSEKNPLIHEQDCKYGQILENNFVMSKNLKLVSAIRICTKSSAEIIFNCIIVNI